MWYISIYPSANYQANDNYIWITLRKNETKDSRCISIEVSSLNDPILNAFESSLEKISIKNKGDSYLIKRSQYPILKCSMIDIFTDQDRGRFKKLFKIETAVDKRKRRLLSRTDRCHRKLCYVSGRKARQVSPSFDKWLYVDDEGAKVLNDEEIMKGDFVWK